MASDPPKPPSSPDALDFIPQPMVAWFRPSELVRAGMKALLSATFGAYADYREMQAALRTQHVEDYSQTDELWIDYIADIGDGFGATYTMARLLAEARLPLTWAQQQHVTQRGRLLIFGGDQVYPTASRAEYQNRMAGPYRAALPWVEEARAPHLFAVPGNHDWYDGLTGFTRLFCQERWIGGWQTKQTRSYFALKLPHGWWLWGIDVQLESDIDQPQLDFFHDVAQNKMAPGSAVLLCTAEPSWVYRAMRGETAYRNFAHFERRCILPFKHTVQVGLAGDLHAYARYQEVGGQAQRFIAGGGGAYLYPTHDLPTTLTLPDVPQSPQTYERQTVFPTVEASKAQTRGALLFPIINWHCSIALAFLYLLYAWLWQSASVLQYGLGRSLLAQLARLEPGNGGTVNAAGEIVFGILAHSPSSITLLAVFVGGLIGFADKPEPRGPRLRRLEQCLAPYGVPLSTVGQCLLGAAHALAHLLVALGLIWCLALVNLRLLGLPVDDARQVVLFGLEMLIGGGLAGGLVMGAYLWLANRYLHVHANEVFLCQSLQDYKSFLRLHLARDGSLTIYPIGVERVVRSRRFTGPRGWRLRRHAQPGEAWIEPPDRLIASYAQLIEAPIQVQRSAPTCMEGHEHGATL